MSVTEWRSIKLDGSLSRRTQAAELGETSDGRWLFVAEGTHVERPGGRSYAHPCDAITLVPPQGLWQATWLRGWDPRLYVDVARRVDDDGTGAIVVIDLDLDVVRRADGAVEVLDRDELESNAVAMGYPRDLVDRANDAAARLEREIRAGDAPFLQVPAVPPAWRHLTADGF